MVALGGDAVVECRGAEIGRSEGTQAMELSLSTRDIGGTVVLDVVGEVDVYTSPRLRERLTELVNEGVAQLVVNLGGVEFIDSTGLGVLVGALKRIRSRSGSMSLVCTSDALIRVFTITGLERVFEIYPTVEEATAPTIA